MKILVLGGSRFFGRDVVQMLLDAGDAVTVLSRGNIAPPEGATHLRGDRNDIAVLVEAASRHFDAVFDNVAFHGRHIQEMLQAFTGKTGHYVFTSSAAVYMPHLRAPYQDGGPVLMPQGLPNPEEWTYSLNKIEAELALFAQNKLSFAILRPPVVIGPNDYTLRLHFYVQRVLDGSPILLPDGGKQAFHLADSLDLAWACVQCLRHPEKTTGKAYNACQRDVLTLDELIRTVAMALQKPAHLISIPQNTLQDLQFEYPDPFAGYPAPMITPPDRLIADVGYSPKPILASVSNAAQWHAEHSRQDSPGYKARAHEIQLAKAMEHAIRTLVPPK